MRIQLSWPAALQPAMTRFDAMSLRERGLIAIALLASMLVVWDSVFMEPLMNKRAALLASMEGADADALQPDAATGMVIDGDAQAATDEAAVDPDPVGTALLQRESQQTQLAAIDRQLQQVAANLIAPDRMSEVLYDVLRQQHNLTLISLHNQPVRSLVPAQVVATGSTAITESGAATASQLLGPGPYVHPVELVVEGRYLDILDYLRALESLPWRLDWQSLQLDASRYPLNRARIEISTLGLDLAWLSTPANR